MRKIYDKLKNLEIVLASSFFVSMLLILLFRVFAGIVSKCIVFLSTVTDISGTSVLAWISANSQWTGEASQWLWVWLVMLGLSEAERQNSNLKVDYFIEKMPRTVANFVKIILDCLYLVAIIYLIFLSFGELTRSQNAQSSTLFLSNLWLYLALTTGMSCLVIRLVLRISMTVKTIFVARGNSSINTTIRKG